MFVARLSFRDKCSPSQCSSGSVPVAVVSTQITSLSYNDATTMRGERGEWLGTMVHFATTFPPDE